VIKFLVFFLFSGIVWGETQLELLPEQSVVNQGEIFTANLALRKGSPPTHSLRGKTFNDTLYIISIDPFIKTASDLQASARVVFVKTTDGSSVTEGVGNEALQIMWKNLQINPTQSDNFGLSTFDIPHPSRIVPWILGILGISVLFILALIPIRKFRSRQRQRAFLRTCRDELLGASKYDEVVEIWKKKSHYLQCFPTLDGAFKKLEEVLFKFQFKPSRSPAEISLVMKAYEEFREKVREGTHGI
jgi:hypothetical protein